jgi:hypothetical protein
MRTLSPSELLDLCDLGEASGPMARAVLLLDAAHDNGAHPRDWPLGAVNAALLRLRARLFGPRLEALANCPQCGAICESELDCLAIADSGPTPSAPLRLTFGEATVSCRLPTPADILAVSRGVEPGQALARRILIEGEAESPENTEALAEAVAAADPLARIELALQCPECGAGWNEPLHVIDILWAELRNLTARLIIDVARLAQAFGWREADILAMSARRRQRYLALLPT